MQLHNTGAEFFVPDGVDPATALARTTHLAVGAHPDDIPIMAYHGILECFGRDDRWFLGVTVTDGAGSPRSDRYADHTDGAMRLVRIVEERKAAAAGEYTAALLLDYTSLAAKDPDGRSIVEELAAILDATHPDVLYTHNLADKHDTHVAVALRTIEAVRAIGPDRRPRAMFGCEVWRDLDWLVDSDKVAFDVSERQNLAAALIGVYDSQISGELSAKRLKLMTPSRSWVPRMRPHSSEVS